ASATACGRISTSSASTRRSPCTHAASAVTGTPATRWGSRSMLKERILTAIVAGSALLLVLFVLPPLAAEIMIAAFFLAAAWEWSGLLKLESRAARLGYVALIGALLVIVGWLLPSEETVDVVLRIGLAWWFAALVWAFFWPTRILEPVGWVCGALVIVPAYVALVELYKLQPGVLLFVLIIVWS